MTKTDAKVENKIVLVDDEIVTMWYYPEKKMVHHRVHKFSYGDTFRKWLMHGTEALRKYKATKWLSDDRDNTVLRQEDMDWGASFWFPETLKAGWKYWAIVRPAAVLAQMNMEQLVKDYSAAGLVCKFFTDPDEAMRWLDAQGK